MSPIRELDPPCLAGLFFPLPTIAQRGRLKLLAPHHFCLVDLYASRAPPGMLCQPADDTITTAGRTISNVKKEMIWTGRKQGPKRTLLKEKYKRILLDEEYRNTKSSCPILRITLYFGCRVSTHRDTWVKSSIRIIQERG